MGLDQLPFLEHIVGQKDPARLQKPQNVFQPVDILSFGGVHKDQVKGTGKFLKDLSRVPFQERDLILSSCSPEIFFCQRDPLLIVLYRSDLKVLRTIFAHKKCGEAHGCPHLQNMLRLLDSQKRLYETLHLSADNRNLRFQSLLLQFFQKRSVSCIQRIDKCPHPLFDDHDSTPSCSASPARIPMILVGV